MHRAVVAVEVVALTLEACAAVKITRLGVGRRSTAPLARLLADTITAVTTAFTETLHGTSNDGSVRYIARGSATRGCAWFRHCASDLSGYGAGRWRELFGDAGAQIFRVHTLTNFAVHLLDDVASDVRHGVSIPVVCAIFLAAVGPHKVLTFLGGPPRIRGKVIEAPTRQNSFVALHVVRNSRMSGAVLMKNFVENRRCGGEAFASFTLDIARAQVDCFRLLVGRSRCQSVMV